jgi:hypothetical protein
MSTQRLNALTHTAQAISFTNDAVWTVIFDHHAAMACFRDKAQAASHGAGVANDVGYRFTQG